MSEKKQQTQPLSTLFTRYRDLSGSASEHVRTSALGGLAVAWLFAGGADGDLGTLASASNGLLVASAAFAACLGADILHYFLGAWAFRHVARQAEDGGSVGEDPVVVLKWVPRLPYVFYNAKVWLLFVGYAILVYVFVDAI